MSQDPLIIPATGAYQIILADPPWDFSGGKKGRPQHYPRMSKKDIMGLPVAQAAAPDCWLFLWVTTPHLVTGLDVLKSWGFKYSSVAFTWVKLRPKACSLFFMESDIHFGQGYTTRKNSEICLLGRKGKPTRLRKDIAEIIIDPRREHSRKPDQSYRRIEAFAAGPRYEMFARQRRLGWDVFGNQVDKFEEEKI